MNPERIPLTEFENCIPNLIKKQGYATSALHGADPSLYARDYWYPVAGLNNHYFFQDLPEGGQCKLFNGRCDVLLMDQVKSLLLSSEKSFVYWLTLNTHAPYDDKIFMDDFNCEEVGSKTDMAVCNNYRLHHQFFFSLGTNGRRSKVKRFGGLCGWRPSSACSKFKRGITGL